MALTNSQLQTLKTDIAADPVLSLLGPDDDSASRIADAYNAAASPEFRIWNDKVSVADVFDQVNWANYTPADAAPTGTDLVYSNRCMLLQTKQMNLQTMLIGRSVLDATKANVRAGIMDATQNLPSGAGGVSRSGGWANIQPILSRAATRAEKLFATGTGSVATPASAAFIGSVTIQEVQRARSL